MTKFPTLSYTYTPSYPSYTWSLEMVKFVIGITPLGLGITKARRKVNFKLVYKIYYLIQQFSYFRMTLKWKRANKTETTNERKQSDLVRLSNGYKRAWFWLVKQTLGWKNFMPEELSRNQSILRFDVIPQHDWPIEQCLLHTEIFFGRKTRSLCLIFHPLGDKTNNELLPKPFFEVIRKSLYSSTGCCSSRLKRIRKLLR